VFQLQRCQLSHAVTGSMKQLYANQPLDGLRSQRSYGRFLRCVSFLQVFPTRMLSGLVFYRIHSVEGIKFHDSYDISYSVRERDQDRITMSISRNTTTTRPENKQHVTDFRCMYEAYSENKYRFAVKKSIKFSYKILLLLILHFSNYFSTYSPPLLKHLS